MKPVLIMASPTGARLTKADHALLPISTEEIAVATKDCMLAGAAAVHVHVRDATGRHSLDSELYREAIAAVREQCGDRIVVQATTESAGIFTPDDQFDALRLLRPRAASVALREVFSEGVEKGEAALHFASEAHIALQYILYDDDDLARFHGLREAGIIPGLTPPRILLVLGRYGAGHDSVVDDLYHRYDVLSRYGLSTSSIWMVCAFGRGELACLEAAIRLGGHVRVGFENAIVDAEGNLATDNAERVALVADALRRCGGEPANSTEAQAILGIA